MPNPIKLGRKERMTFSKINEVAEMPNLIQIQTDSYKWFVEEGLREVFEDVSPIKGYTDNLVLEFIDYSLTDPPKYEQEECKSNAFNTFFCNIYSSYFSFIDNFFNFWLFKEFINSLIDII